MELERAKQEAVERERTVTRTLQSLEQVRASADASVQVTLAERDAQQVPARQLKDSIERASLAVDQARMKLQRAEKIADAGLISGQELEEARFAFRLALDDLTNATRTSESHDRLRKAQETDLRLRRSLTLKAADQQLASLGAAAQQAVLTLKQVQMRYDEAASRLADPVIRAPRAGVVTELAAHVGDRLAVGALIARIASIDPVHIDVDVSPLLANALAAGMTARVDVAAVLQKNLTATVRAIAPLPNDNGKYVALLALPNPGRARIAGLAAVVAFETAPPADLPRIDWLGNGKVLWQRAVAGAKAWVENWPALTRRAVADAKGWAEDWPALTRRAVADAKAWVESWPALTRRAVADAKAWAENWPALWRRTEADALASEEHHR